MNGPRVLGICIGLGIMASAVGVDQCATGYAYSVAARHQATTVGRITRVDHGKGGPYYRYVFSANGAKVDDYSGVCSTPLTPDACWNNGQVLVYYSYEPYANSRLEDFGVASTHCYKIGVPWLLFGVSLFILGVVISTLSRRNKSDGDGITEEDTGENDCEDVEQPIHIVPNA